MRAAANAPPWRIPLRLVAWLLAVVILLGAEPAGAATLPGVPVPPRPGAEAAGWAALLNDDLGGGVRSELDDFRTHAFYGAAKLGERWVLGVDAAILTNQGFSGFEEGRADELTVSLGRTVWSRSAEGREARLLAGFGGRHTGDLGGGGVQRWLHDAFGVVQVDPPYEEQVETHGLGYLHGTWSLSRPAAGVRGLPAFAREGRLGLELDAGALLTTGGEAQGTFGARFSLLARDAAVWTGLRYEARAGSSTNPTTEAVARREEGLWAGFGAGVGPFFLEIGQHLENDAALGRLGWLWNPASEPGAGPGELTVDLGIVPDGPGAGVALRWRSRWAARHGAWGERLSLLLDYRFGRTAGVDLLDQQLQFQQLLAGVDLALRPPGEGMRLVPFAAAGIGWRQEEVTDETDDDEFSPRFAEGSASAPVVQASLGLRWLLPAVGREGRLRASVSLAVDSWAPLSGGSVAGLGGRPSFEILESGAALGLRVGLSVGR